MCAEKTVLNEVKEHKHVIVVTGIYYDCSCDVVIVHYECDDPECEWEMWSCADRVN